MKVLEDSRGAGAPVCECKRDRLCGNLIRDYPPRKYLEFDAKWGMVIFKSEQSVLTLDSQVPFEYQVLDTALKKY